MNEIVRKHYPAAKLPADLRGTIEPSRHVTVTVVEEEGPEHVMSLDELFALNPSPGLSKQEIDEHIRALRDEWE